MQTWSLQSAQQLLTRTVDRGAVLCPGEQTGTQLPLALGTARLQNHSSGRNPAEGRGGVDLRGGRRQAGGTASSKDLGGGDFNVIVCHRCLWESDGICGPSPRNRHVCDVLHRTSGASETPWSNAWNPSGSVKNF